jgi:hypothetical protein
MTIKMTMTSERPRYFPSQVITADDLTLDQEYFREKLKRHNRMLHGWGIVCGTKVEGVPDKPWFVKVNPGYIIGPYGDEICIEKAVCCDLRIKCSSTVTPDTPDPCADSVLQLPPPSGGPVFLVIQYQQDMTRPVRVKASGCGCGENPCEYSRSRDGYRICVLDTLPASHNPPPPGGPGGAPGEAPDCPPSPVDPWVVLAKVTVGADGTVGAIDLSNRRILARH